MAKGDGLKAVARPKVLAPAATGAWLVTGVLHASHLGMAATGCTAAISLAATGVTFGAVTRYGKDFRKHAVTASAAAGAWVTAAMAAGPVAGPYAAMTWLLGGMTLAEVVAVRRNKVIKAAEQAAAVRERWREEAAQLGLAGSVLIEHRDTRLGEWMRIGTAGTGRLASQCVGPGLAELIAQRQQPPLPTHRVRVNVGDVAGTITIAIRSKDPWEKDIPHPLFDARPEIELGVPCSVKQPLIVGQDPETGAPLAVTLWEAGHGAKNVLVGAMRDGGKSVLLNCLRERITAAEDAVLVAINLSKAREEREWAPACFLSAIGSQERERALAILRYLNMVIQARSAIRRTTAEFVPSPSHPLIALVVDETDELVRGNDPVTMAIREELDRIATKGRSEGVALILAGQRATAVSIGGATVRSQMEVVCCGRTRSDGEQRHILGDWSGYAPNMMTYGNGRSGVWLIATGPGEHRTGRTFNLKSPRHLRQLATARADMTGALEYELAVPLGTASRQIGARVLGVPQVHDESLAYPYPAGSGTGTGTAAAPGTPGVPENAGTPGSGDPGTAAPGTVLDGYGKGQQAYLAETAPTLDLTSTVPPDVAERLERIRQANTLGSDRLAAVEGTVIKFPSPTGSPEAGRSGKEIPPDVRKGLLADLEGGTTIPRVSEAYQASRWIAREWLNILRSEGFAQVSGSGRAARWSLVQGKEDLTPDAPGGDERVI